MPEGNSFTNLLQLMKTQGYNKDLHVSVGLVKSVSPLKVMYDSFELESEDFVATQTIRYLIKGLLGDGEKLKSGDKVLMLIDGNNFYVLDRVV